MFTADFQNYFYELAEKDYAMGVDCRDNMPDEYYHAYSTLYSADQCAEHQCMKTPEEQAIAEKPYLYVTN